MEIGGSEEEQVKGFKNLVIVLLISVTAIFLSLVYQFKNAIKPFVVFAAVPYGIVGGLTALWIMGTPFGFSNSGEIDAHCAAVYLTEKTDVAFRPFGLDLFDKLVKACKAVRGRLESEQRALGAALEFPLVRLRKARFEINLGAAEMKQPDHAVAVEELVVLKHRRELGVRVDPMIGTVQLSRYFALDFEVMDVALKSIGAQRTRKSGSVWVFGHGNPSSPRGDPILSRAGAASRRRAN